MAKAKKTMEASFQSRIQGICSRCLIINKNNNKGLIYEISFNHPLSGCFALSANVLIEAESAMHQIIGLLLVLIGQYFLLVLSLWKQ